MPLPRDTSAPLTIGPYTLYGVLSSGGMATVHFGRLAGPVGFTRTVAIKRLHPHYARVPELVSMFVDEARVVSHIRHPNVVPTLDVVQTADELFLVMEYVHGESLSKLLTNLRVKKERVPLAIVSAILSGVLHGLHAAHEAKHPRKGPLHIVHRDVSPQNVLVGTDGTARILDFGVAKAMDRIQVTREGQLKGKIAYMAPEQLRGEQASPATDIFAASTVLWETLTGRRLFNAENEGATVKKILELPISAPSTEWMDTLDEDSEQPRGRDFDERLDALVLRGLSRNPRDRFATAREMARQLEALITPATPSEVGEWVERLAAGALAERAQRLAETDQGGAGPLGRAHVLAELQVHEAPSQPSAGGSQAASAMWAGGTTGARQRADGAATRATTSSERGLYVVAALVLVAAAVVGAFVIYLIWRQT